MEEVMNKNTAVISRLIELFKANEQNKEMREAVRQIIDLLGKTGIKRLSGEFISQNVNDSQVNLLIQIIRQQLKIEESVSDEEILYAAHNYFYHCVERSL